MLLKLENYENILPYIVIGERTNFFDKFLASVINSPISIVKKARRAKKEVGKKSKSKQPGSILQVENGKPGTYNLNN